MIPGPTIALGEGVTPDGLDAGLRQGIERYPAHPCAAMPANSKSPASRLERKSLSAVAASAPSTLESCQPRWAA